MYKKIPTISFFKLILVKMFGKKIEFLHRENFGPWDTEITAYMLNGITYITKVKQKKNGEKNVRSTMDGRYYRDTN